MYTEFLTRKLLRRLTIGALLGIGPLILSRGMFVPPGFPIGHEVFSNLLPALHARASLANGMLPVYTDLFYAGRYQFANPLWYGFYPPAWPLLVPGLPMAPTIKVLIGAHLVAATAVAYVFARSDLRPRYALPLALLFVLPIASQVHAAHLEKIFAWPWVVIAVWQLRPHRLDAPVRRFSFFGSDRSYHKNGVLTGVSLGCIALAGGNYYALYVGLFVLLVSLHVRAFSFLRSTIAAGAVVALPHALSVLVVVAGGVARGAVGYQLSPVDAVALLAGIPSGPWFMQGYAGIGLGAMLLGIYGAKISYPSMWARGMGSSLVVAFTLAFMPFPLYLLPGANINRVAARANVFAALVILMLCWRALYALEVDRGKPCELPMSPLKTGNHLRTVVVVILLFSVVQAGYGWSTFDDTTVTIENERTVAGLIEERGCSSVWIGVSHGSGLGAINTHLAYAATERGIAVRATHYGDIGQEWRTKHANGTLAFDALLVGSPLPKNGSVSLPRGNISGRTDGIVDVDRFGEPVRYNETAVPVYIYPTSNCESTEPNIGRAT